MPEGLQIFIPILFMLVVFILTVGAIIKKYIGKDKKDKG